MIKIGIECESIEGKNPMFGVGRIIMKLVEEISRRPELEKNFRFILYFKDRVPDFDFLKTPIFEKKTVSVPFFKNRLFPIYYFALLPMRLWFDRPNMMFWPNYMLPIIAFGKSLVILTEDVYYETHEGKLPFRYRLAYGIFGWWTAKFATKIIAISETSKRNLAKLYGIRPERIVVNYLGIDFGDKGQGAKDKDGDYLLFVGQAFPRRHLKETLLAFEKIANEFPKLKFVAVGPDKYPAPEKADACDNRNCFYGDRAGPEPTINPLVAQTNKRLGRDAIIHRDYVKDSELAELYAGASALIYVSDIEAFGLPPMEALSLGIPPIVMDNELGHELFGDHAFYSKSGEIDDIAEAIKKALTDTEKIQKIKGSCLEFAKKYNWKSFADRFLNIVKNHYARNN